VFYGVKKRRNDKTRKIFYIFIDYNQLSNYYHMKKNYFLSLLLTLFISVFSFGQSPIITAIVDGDCSGGNPKLLEIYAKGTVDFTLYSLENQTNSNSTWGNTQDLSSLGTVTDAFVYISTSGSSAGLTSDFPSVSSVLETNTINVNGDDRVRIILTSDSSVIDQYGVESTDGDGTAWEYKDSYAKRIDGTGPDASFTEANWTFGGVSALNTLGVCQGGSDTFETLIDGVGTYSATASTTPTITVTGSTTSFDYFEGNGPSGEQSVTVSGVNLTTDINVVAPTNFEVSLTSGSGFGNSLTITESGGAASETLYMRLAAGLTPNTYTGDIIGSSAGAVDNTGSLTGTVSPADPQFSYTAFLNDFNYVISDAVPSVEQTFTVQGLFLTADLVVTAPTNFEASLTSGSGFVASVNITPSSGTVAETTIYTRLKSGLTAGNYTGNITISSTGVVDKTISVKGNAYGAPTNSMIITGVYDGTLSGGTPKGVEVYVLNDIADLTLFGVSSVGNGGGSTAGNIEFPFPAGSATAGTFIYVATEATNFNTFFGMAPTHTSGSMNINGDDSVELYESGQIIDVFGDVIKDGTGEAWEYLDGWAYRKSNTAPEGTTFTLANWTYSGVDGLEGGTNNATATTPFPTATYVSNTASIGDNIIEGFTAYPNPVQNGRLTVTTSNSKEKEVSIYSILGKRVFTQKFSGSKKQLDVSQINSGIYIMKVIEGDKIATKKVVIK
jgi:hypothetical protein